MVARLTYLRYACRKWARESLFKEVFGYSARTRAEIAPSVQEQSASKELIINDPLNVLELFTSITTAHISRETQPWRLSGNGFDATSLD